MLNVNQMLTAKWAELAARIPSMPVIPKNNTYLEDSKPFKDTLDEEIKNTTEIQAESGKTSDKITSSQSSAYKSASRIEIENIAETMAAKHGVDPALVKAVIKAESGFNPTAVSSAGARGLMQLMPATAKGLGVEDSFDIVQNIDGGARYLKQKLDSYNGNVDLTLAAYNAGSGAVQKYNGIPPYKETQNYVKIVNGYMKEFAN